MTAPQFLIFQLIDGKAAGDPFELRNGDEFVLGRGAEVDIGVDAKAYPGVSRQHAALRCRALPDGTSTIELKDLGSANGSYVNGEKVSNIRTLSPNDVIMLGGSGPEFAVDSPNREEDELTWSMVVPVSSHWRDAFTHPLFKPMVATIVAACTLFALYGVPKLFNTVLAVYLALAAYYYIYRLCERPKPFWVPAVVALSTAALLLTPVWWVVAFVFRDILPGGAVGSSAPFMDRFVSHLYGAGLAEEFLKALPVLFCLLWANRLRSPWREALALKDPLDGILIGAASGIGFALLETLGQYVPYTVYGARNYWEGELLGLHVLLARTTGLLGHMGYSAYLGFFVGLGAMMPSRRWALIVIGWVTASTFHALWNALNNLALQTFTLALVYLFLSAAIMRAQRFTHSPGHAAAPVSPTFGRR